MKFILTMMLAGSFGLAAADEVQPFSFKNIQLNSTIDVANSYSQILCKELPEDKKVLGDKQCTYMKPGPYGQLNPDLATFGGAPVNYIFMNYFNDRLKEIFVSVESKSFSQIVGALREKYGPPLDEKRVPIQTKAGAVYENVVMKWRSGESTLTAEKYFGSVDSSALKFEMDDYITEVGKRRKEKSKQGASDL